MKKNFTYTLVAAIAMLLSVNAFAQKSIATVSTSTASKMIDEKTSVVTFQVSNVANEAAKQKMIAAFKSNQGVIDATGTLQGTTATYNVTMPKQGRMRTVQAILVKAGIESVNVDGTTVESAKLVEYAHAKKQEGKTRK